MNIILDSNPSDAPCCVKIIADNGQDLLIQSDWDFVGIASTFGFSLASVQGPGREWHLENFDNPPCQHRKTDGTVVCPDCGVQPGRFIEAAREWLDDNDGAQVEDPCYFF